MRKLLIALVAVALVLPAAGCNSDREKGIYKDRDKPRAPDKAG